MATILRRHSKDHHRQPPKPVDGRCRKHPKHRQSPGVCSLCLQERLSQLMTKPTPSRRTTSTTTAGSSGSSTTSSLSSYYSSSDSSSCSSPMQQYHCNRYRNCNDINIIGRDGKASSNSMSAFLFSGGNNVLKKSRSLAFGHRSTRVDNCDDDQKRKTGFFSKLFASQGKIQRTFMHSRTVRERVHG